MTWRRTRTVQVNLTRSGSMPASVAAWPGASSGGPRRSPPTCRLGKLLTCHLLLRDLERMLRDSLTVAAGGAGSLSALRELAYVIHECQQRLRIGRELVGLFAGGLGDPIKDALGFVQLGSTRFCHCSEPVGVVVIDDE